ncbi:5-carboxymethyl-2-hydroxymuconate Delta-isomerase [Pontibacillus litoralis]|uniref:5-carboxymethyl-2-hydroxymuconate isomerase n=1 Tax=Pontibacillus litoralis JSM 072002 TaxID=1385512 RepID=A0A0A5G0G7_9BACI|nr:5-carboxymethyl-2-hydroxymuconate Delta-isomerase [Pontibacillus litoralis]KGX84550.1 5-carboxymethyl-2-hydroxymuconate isomerase [Pontibacillus litoralis JSM 072002]
MPHVILEYTDNLSQHTDIQLLLEKINSVLIEKKVYPIGGIRSRAHEVNYYHIADGKEKDAFVHAILKIGKGRTEEVKKATCEQVFETIKTHFEEYCKHHYLALSLELIEFQHATLKSNNIHERFK